ncbi:MAG: sigma-70 family RNA polymerase sigma factor [bacterium]|nr:sigma-70 family RNA polymerase sigma factor [bacterium]
MSNFFNSFSVNEGCAGFSDLLCQYESRVYVAALALTGSQEIAEDVLSDVFARLYRTHEQLPPDFNYLPYISELVVNACQGFSQRIKGNPSMASQMEFADFELDGMPTGEMGIVFQAIRPVMIKALAVLPAEYRQIIILKEFFKNDYRDCASILALDSSVIRALHRRACSMLRRVLRREETSFVKMPETMEDDALSLFRALS